MSIRINFRSKLPILKALAALVFLSAGHIKSNQVSAQITISGKITNAEGQGTPGLVIEIIGAGGEFFDEATTDIDGNYSFTGLFADNYSVSLATFTCCDSRTQNDYSLAPVSQSGSVSSNQVWNFASTPMTQLGLDREALISLYRSTNGATWADNTSWLSSNEIRLWAGVTAEFDGNSESYFLTEVDLRGNGLSGVLPPEWATQVTAAGGLATLEYFDLGNNNIGGSILPSVGSLPSLLELHLFNNLFNGPIPAQLGNLNALTILSLYTNQLSGSIPPALNALVNLTRLSLYQNSLNGSIPDLSALTQLESLGLGDNNLSGSLPGFFGDLTLLNALDLRRNSIEGPIPASLGNLAVLNTLHLNSNLLTGSIPASIGNLSSVSILNLSENLLTGDVPESFANLSGIDLALDSNFLEGLPDFTIPSAPGKSGNSEPPALGVSENLLSFEDLEPNVDHPNISYSPQLPYGSPQNVEVIAGTSYAVSFPTGGSANTYTFFHNEVEVQSGPSDSFSIPNVQAVFGGLYRAEVTSVLVPGLVLDSEPLTLTVLPGDPILNITRPSDSPELFTTGTTESIEWTFEQFSFPGNVKIELWTGGAFFQTITESTPNDGVFEWTIPLSIPSGSDYRVVLFSDVEAGVIDQSVNPFEITAVPVPEIVVVSPNGGETFIHQSTNAIQWTSQDIVGTVSIELFKGGSLDRLIAGDIVNSGVFSWLVPESVVAGIDYRVRVVSSADPGVFGESLTDFAVDVLLEPAITVLRPNIGGTFFKGTTEDVQWSSTDHTGNVKIELFDGLTFAATVSSNTPDTGTFTWNIPTFIPDGQNYVIRVSSLTQPQISDESDQPFSLAAIPAAEIAVTSPNGGEEWLNPSTEQILWTRQNINGSVAIDLLLGESVVEIVSGSTPNDGTFNWQIPEGLAASNNYKIRIRSLDQPGVLDSSDLPFSLTPVVAPPSPDRDALLALFASTNGTGWVNNTNWGTDEPIETWFGVEVVSIGNDVRVQRLLLSSNNLSGVLPAEWATMVSQNNALGVLAELNIGDNQLNGTILPVLGDLASLVTLDASVNQFDDLADLSGSSTLQNLAVQNNRLTFGPLEANAGISNFEYSPQLSIGEAGSLSVLEGQTFSVDISTDGSNNIYQWFLGGSPIPGATGFEYRVLSAVPSDAGDYQVAVTNTLLPDLTLQGLIITVDVGLIEITATLPTQINATAGTEIPLQAVIPAGYTPQTREYCFRMSGVPTYDCRALLGTGTELTGTIPGSAVTERGLEYFYRFVDGDFTRSLPEVDPEGRPFVVVVPISGIVAPIVVSDRTYRMISVPLSLDNPSATSVLPGINTSAERLLRWNTSSTVYDESPRVPATFTPGKAFWYISSTAEDFSVSGGESVDASTPFLISLAPGWTQVGNPFAFPISWSSVLNAEQVDAPVSFDPSLGAGDQYLYNQETIFPWDGYWVFNPLSSPVELGIVPQEASGSPGKGIYASPVTAEATYSMQLKASDWTRGLSDTQNYLGFAPGASEEYDRFDFAEAPALGRHIRLSIVQNEARLAGSFKELDTDGTEWAIEISLSSQMLDELKNESISVRLEETGMLPQDQSVYIIDDDSKERIPIVESAFTVQLTPDHPVKHLRVIVGTSEFADKKTDGIALTPQHFRLEQNYPNPFNPTTRIRYQLKQATPVHLQIFNALGQHVKTLVDREQNAGWYELDWDGRTANGVLAATGHYFYRFTAGTTVDTKTMILLR